MEKRATWSFLNTLKSFWILLIKNEYSYALWYNQSLELPHSEHDYVHYIVVLLHKVKHCKKPLNLHLIDLICMLLYTRHQWRATLRPIHSVLAKLRHAPNSDSRGLRLLVFVTHIIKHVDWTLVEAATFFLVGKVLEHLSIPLQCGT